MRVRTEAILAVLAVLTLAGCGRRNEAPMTQCVGGKPAVERIEDVAPPNCLPEAAP